ncbi:hypothetical protein [Zobellella denitrificans]|jgi:hypothetical protein|uniref:hypothetical protein n=1 Tax=Zobellella denitrificans TaxID=347534 RepID=UPI001595BA2F|nr:hypothetical protein [Zobellella denitrificans]
MKPTSAAPVMPMPDLAPLLALPAPAVQQRPVEGALRIKQQGSFLLLLLRFW